VYRNFDQATLERQYSPSSCIDDIKVFITQYIEQSRAASEFAQQQQSLMADLSYGEHTDQLLDLYLPLTINDNNRKLQVYIHGGYWQELTKAESSFAATNFQKQGCHFAVIDYALAPNATLSEIVAQVRQAINWLFKNAERLGYDSDQIYLSGSSAGAHLAMMALQDSTSQGCSRVQGVCAVSGIYDLLPLVDTYVNDAIKMDIAEAQQNSPIGLPLPMQSVIMAYGQHETSEFKRQSAMMAEKIVRNGNEISCQQIADRNHFDVILDLADPRSWLCRQVFAQMSLVAVPSG